MQNRGGEPSDARASPGRTDDVAAERTFASLEVVPRAHSKAGAGQTQIVNKCLTRPGEQAGPPPSYRDHTRTYDSTVRQYGTAQPAGHRERESGAEFFRVRSQRLISPHVISAYLVIDVRRTKVSASSLPHFLRAFLVLAGLPFSVCIGSFFIPPRRYRRQRRRRRAHSSPPAPLLRHHGRPRRRTCARSVPRFVLTHPPRD